MAKKEMARRRGKLLYKLLVLFLFLATVPLLVVRTRVLQVGQKSMKKQSLNIQLEIARRSADTAAAFVEDIKNILFVVQKPREFVAMDISKQRIILENLMKSYPAFMKLAVLDEGGLMRLRIPRFGEIEMEPGVDHSHHPLFTKAIEDGEWVSNVYRSSENYPFILVSVPIELYAGRAVGVLVAEVNLIALSSQIAQIKIGQEGFSFVVDQQGNPIAHPEQKIVLAAKNLKGIPLVETALTENQEGGEEFIYRGESFLGTYVPVKKLGWKVIVQQPCWEAYAPAAKMRKHVNMFLLGALIITLGIGFFFSYRLVKPIKILQGETEKVAAGDFNTRIDVNSNDEIGVLAEKFSFMSGALKKMTGALKKANEELDKWNKELEDRVEERTRQLREAQAKLIQSERLAALGQMANVIGHEIRNPLAAINSAAYLLKEIVPEDPDVKKSLEVIDREVKAANRIAADMLGFSRTRAPVRHAVDVNALLEESFSILSCPKSVNATRKFAPGLPKGMIDRDEIRQVFTNLIKNAFEIMDEKTHGGRLVVKSEVVDSQIQISVADTGPGISAENMKKMFTPFFSTKARGTGLGLAACQRIVERHAGKIWVESEGEGKGATFFVRLPIAK